MCIRASLQCFPHVEFMFFFVFLNLHINAVERFRVIKWMPMGILPSLKFACENNLELHLRPKCQMFPRANEPPPTPPNAGLLQSVLYHVAQPTATV